LYYNLNPVRKRGYSPPATEGRVPRRAKFLTGAGTIEYKPLRNSQRVNFLIPHIRTNKGYIDIPIKTSANIIAELREKALEVFGELELGLTIYMVKVSVPSPLFME
jgi:hypothetical protein